jgi:F-type H+-transporting ATPase subunit b
MLGVFLMVPARPMRGLEGAANDRTRVPINAENADARATRSETEEFRHSAAVQAIARFLHVSTEVTAQIFEDINSGILIVVTAYFLWKYLPGIFRRRSATLEKELTAAHAATEDANRRLAEVEARLSRLDREIEAIRRQAEKDLGEDEKRLQAQMASEKERIVASAEQEIAAAQAAAQRELKKFAADLAIDSAMRRIQLSAETDRALVKEFGTGLANGSGGKA